jgi:nuclear GTP-binding protein
VRAAATEPAGAQGGVPNTEAAARAVLRDWNEGRIAFYTVPPQAASCAAPACVRCAPD